MFDWAIFMKCFFEDAVTTSRELKLTLTARSCGQDEKAPMCGVPYHAAESYIQRLVEKGYKVAICDQMADPRLAKGLVKRGNYTDCYAGYFHERGGHGRKQ